MNRGQGPYEKSRFAALLRQSALGTAVLLALSFLVSTPAANAAVSTACIEASIARATSRFNACKSVITPMRIISDKGVTVGTFMVQTVTSTRVNRSELRINNATSIRVLKRTGAAVGLGLRARGLYDCNDIVCTTKYQAFDRPIGSSWTTTESTATFKLSEGKSIFVPEWWQFRVTAPGLRLSGIATAAQLNPRCDNNAVANMGKGCVFTGYTPAFRVSTAGEAGQMAKHIKKALATRLPSTLTRASTAVNAKNRSKACRNIVPLKGYECDEYPFASANQGAASGGKLRVLRECRLKQISGDGPKGWSQCMILKTHNQAGGRLLNDFYRQNRVLVKDKYKVKVAG